MKQRAKPVLFEIDITQLHNVCRICLKFGQIPIFGDEITTDISADIIKFAEIEININDNFPKFICNSCKKLLEIAILFKNTAKHSDGTLRNKYQAHQENNGVFSNQITENCADMSSITNTETQKCFLSTVNICIDSSDLLNSLKEESKPSEQENKPLEKLKKCYSEANVTEKDINYNSEEYAQGIPLSEYKATEKLSKVECSICLKKISKPYYKKHLTAHSTETEKMKHKCSVCNKLISRTYFKEHLRRCHNHDNKLYKPRKQVCVQCPICNNMYKKEYLKHHIAIHTHTSKYICDTCGKSFIQMSAFKRHSLIHGSDFSFKCQMCPYRGRHKGLLKTHMLTHSKEYQHQCSQCSARFLTKSNLNKHLQRHKGPVDFKCETCKRGFYSKLELERHYKADHLGIKNDLCNMCGKAFGNRNRMMSHQLRVHKRAKKTSGKGRLPLYLEGETK